MTPRGPGCHCAACQKTVVDFTLKTDAEILAVVGFETKQVAVVAKTGVPVVEVALALNTMWLGETTLISPPSGPWYPRRFYYWLTRPFRRN
jgi:hypothetical protein